MQKIRNILWSNSEKKWKNLWRPALMHKSVKLGKTTLLKFSGISGSLGDCSPDLCKAQFVCNDNLLSCTVPSKLVFPCMANEVGNPFVYCNICCATLCEHSPSVFSVDNSLQLSYNSDVIALGVIPSFSPPRSYSVPLNLLSYNCMHMADSEDDKMVSNERALFLIL